MMDSETSAKYARLRSEIDRVLKLMESECRLIESAITEVLKLGLVVSVATIGPEARAARVGGFPGSDLLERLRISCRFDSRLPIEEAMRSKLFLLSKSQMARISPCFPLAHGVPRVDDRRVVSGIVYLIPNGLQWKDAPKAFGHHKTLYIRFIWWSRLGLFDSIFASLAGEGPRPERT